MTHRPAGANDGGARVVQAAAQPASRLARKLGVGDAVVIGLGAMIGAGIFAALGPAADAAGSGLLVGLLVAALVAYCNATSSAALASLYPESGGTYVYGRKRLNAFWGFLAGWGFVVGKLASCAAMALTFAYYAAPSLARPLAFAAVVAMTAVNYFGVAKTAAATRVIVVIVLSCLALVVFAAAFGGQAELSRMKPTITAGAHDPARDSIGARHHTRRLCRGRRHRAGRRRRRGTCARACAARGGDCRRSIFGVGAGGSHRRDGRIARRIAVAAGRRQPHRVRDGRERRSADIPGIRASALSRSRPRGTAGRRDRRRRRAARRYPRRDRLQLVRSARLLRNRECVSADPTPGRASPA